MKTRKFTGDMADQIDKDREELIALRAQVEQLKWDIEAYRGALGYSIPGSHTGKLIDGTTPQCGLCNSEYRKGLESSVEQLTRECDEARAACAFFRKTLQVIADTNINSSILKYQDLPAIAFNTLSMGGDCGTNLLSALNECVNALNYFSAAIEADILHGNATLAQWGVAKALIRDSLAHAKEALR